MTKPGKQQPGKQRGERTELLDEAARHLRSNALAKALPLYQQLYDQDPTDWTVANALGDLHVRMNNTDDAVNVLMDLAEHLAGQGHSGKARALYRKLLRMRPGDAAATARVAELENEHLDASPIMQRVRGALLDAQAAAPSEPAPTFHEPAFQEPAFEAPAEPIPPPPSPALTFTPAPTPAPPPAWAPPRAVPRAPEPEPPAASFAALAEFDPGSDDWIAVGATLAAAPLQDRPSNVVNAARLSAFQRMEAAARRAAAAGDYRGACGQVETFLRGYAQDVEALELLVEFGVDGRLDEVGTSQLRLADACLATGRASTGRHVALDLLHRHPADAAVGELVTRVLVAGGVARPVSPIEARRPAATRHPVAADAGELFDDDGLVTADAPRRAPVAEPVPSRGADSLDDWLDASDVSDARTAVATASRHAAGGNFAAAKATLEPLMRTPSLRPIVGVCLAQLYRRENDYAKALHCLEQAAEQPAMHEDNAHALAYELALTLEAMGQRHEALALYRELLSEVGPAFRDVAARAQQLSAA